MLVVLVVVLSSFISSAAAGAEECSFWCQLKQFFSGEREAVVGKGAQLPDSFVINKVTHQKADLTEKDKHDRPNAIVKYTFTKSTGKDSALYFNKEKKLEGMILDGIEVTVIGENLKTRIETEYLLALGAPLVATSEPVSTPSPAPVPASASPPAPAAPTEPDLTVLEAMKNLLPEGTTIISTTTKKEFKVVNGKFVQTKKGNDQNDAAGKVVDSAELGNLNDKYKYVPGDLIIHLPQEVVSQRLGKTISDQYYAEIDWAILNWKEYNPNSGTFALKNDLGKIERTQEGLLTTISITVNDIKKDGKPLDQQNSRTVLMMQGQEIATQSVNQKGQGTITVGGQTLLVENGKDVKEVITGDTPTPFYADEQARKDRKEKGKIEHKDKTTTVTDFELETQTVINIKTGETQQLEGDYYKKGDHKNNGNCKDQSNGCFIPTGGTLTQNDGRQYLADYDYTGTGADRELERVELFNPASGRFEGVKLDKDTIISAEQDGKGGYTGRFLKNGGECSGECLSTNKKTIDEIKEYTEGYAGKIQIGLQSIYAITNSIKSYPALSNLFFGGTDWYQNWQRKADQAFAPLLGSNWIPSAICESHYDIEPEGVAVIKTASGTYQAVASIQMERSSKKSPLLCYRNPDEEAEEEFTCSKGQVCVDDNFCYKDADDDGEPDEDTLLEGFFYKITWGVSAPRDETFTPLRDENGIAVSFNVYIDTIEDNQVSAGAIPLYNLEGNTQSPVTLKNGQQDRDVIVKYSPREYQEACIKWHQPPRSMAGASGWNLVPVVAAARETAGEPVGDVCFTVVTSTAGEVNFERAGREVPPSTVSGGQVGRNEDW